MRAESWDITTDLILIQTPSRLWRLGWSTNVGWDSEDTRLCGTESLQIIVRVRGWSPLRVSSEAGQREPQDGRPRTKTSSPGNWSFPSQTTPKLILWYYSTHPHLFNAKPDLIVDHHDHSLCSPASSFLVYPRRKLFSSWKVCKCKTASLSDRGGTILNVETHTNPKTHI